MDLLERAWDGVGNFMGSLMHGFERGVTSLFGTSNARYIRKLQARVEAINALEPTYQAMSDAELREQTVKFRERLKGGETLEALLIEAFGVCREGGRRFLGMRHYDVQLIGGMVLHSGSIAEMVTGEGKTLVATLPAYLNALEGKGVHVVTVNDYLARRDCEWMLPIYQALGITAGYIQADMDPENRRRAYDCDITYGTNSEFGFDYLRDNMKFDLAHCVQRGHQFAIVDEVDSILIDEARTPLIISGPSEESTDKYAKIDKIIPKLIQDIDYTTDEKHRTATLTEEGFAKCERLLSLTNMSDPANIDIMHHVYQALRAHTLYKHDVDYVVKDGEVIIVDEFTGDR